MTHPTAIEALAAGAARGLLNHLRAERPDLAWKVEVRPVDRAKLAQLAAWSHMSMEERERLLLDVLGTDRLTMRELKARLEAEVDDSIWDSTLRSLISRLINRCELDREYGQWGKCRRRYFRWRDLSGPIADLDEQFNGGKEGKSDA